MLAVLFRSPVAVEWLLASGVRVALKLSGER